MTAAIKTLNLLTPILLTVAATVSFADGIPVQVRPLQELLFDQEVRAPATVVAGNYAEIKSQVTALVEKVVADVGATVNKGDILILLDASNAELALARARASRAAVDAQITEARARVANAEDLQKKNFISDEEIIARRANLAVLEANKLERDVAVDSAELDLQRTTIRAPFAGYVIWREAQVGSYAQPGTPLITLAQSADRELSVALDPRFAASIGQVASLRFESQGATWAVRLRRLAPVIDTTSRVVTARMTFVDDAAPIGSSGQLVWNESSGLLPVDLIVQRGQVLGVFVVEGSAARFVPIAGAQEGRPAAVDLPGDTQVVSRGHTRLQDGDKLQISRE